MSDSTIFIVLEVMKSTVTKQFTVENENGLHARPSASFVKKANEFQSTIEVIKEDENMTVNGKSILGLLCLGAGKGTTLTVKAEGDDAEEAVYALGSLFKNKFGEDR